MDLVPTPSQTIGPFFQCLLDSHGAVGSLAGPTTKGERIKLVCRLLDGNGAPVNDGLIELWQADADGRFDPAGCRGFGRLPTNEEGNCVFDTIRPGRVTDSTPQASHVNLSVFARGLLNRLVTRIYFSGDPANGEDPVLQLVPEDRRETLMAHPDSGQPGVWNFEIHLQGERETVFFDV